MTVHAVRLPVDIERGAIGGPLFSTFVIPTTSGNEQRNQNWTHPVRIWDISYGILDETDLKAVLDFYILRFGRFYAWLFRDWSDYELTDEAASVIAGTGGLDYQINKTYTDAANTYVRPITQIDESEAQTVVKVNGVTFVETTQYTLDNTTGVISFDPGELPLAGPVTVTGQFNIPVRFDDDKLNIRLVLAKKGSVPPITVKEIRV